MAWTYLTRVSLLPSCSWSYASLSINLPSWDTPRMTVDDILSTVTYEQSHRGALILCVICLKDIGISTLHHSLQQSINIISRVEGVAWSLEEALYDRRMPRVGSRGGRTMDPCWNVAPKNVHVLSTIYFPWIHAGTMITLTTPNERLERICIASVTPQVFVTS